MNKRPDYEIAREELSAILVSKRIDIRAKFVPLSQSRNANTDWQSLNWKIDIVQHPAMNADKATPVVIMRDIDYAQGSAHCPAYKGKGDGSRAYNAKAIAMECETGRIAKIAGGGSGAPYASAKDIPPPAIEDVFYSLLMDSDVLNYRGFEDWADNFGYDTDSRKADATYRYCLEIALQLRARFGDKQFSKMQEIASRF